MNLKNNLKPSPKRLNDYAIYSGIAFQMAAIILVGVFGGIKLDALLKLKFPVFTVVLSFFSVVLAIYYVIKGLLKKTDNAKDAKKNTK